MGITGNFKKDSYIKDIQWVVKTADGTTEREKKGSINCAPKPYYVVISNFEAEYLSQYLCSKLADNDLTNDMPKVYSFISLIRNGQKAQHLRATSLTQVPASLHILAGSIHAEKETQMKMTSFLGIHPRPLKKEEADEWDKNFKKNVFERDGFVARTNRLQVFGDGNSLSPFETSPIQSLKMFLSESRHLIEELPSSPLGRRLGCSSVTATTK